MALTNKLAYLAEKFCEIAMRLKLDSMPTVSNGKKEKLQLYFILNFFFEKKLGADNSEPKVTKFEPKHGGSEDPVGQCTGHLKPVLHQDAILVSML